MFNLTSEHIKDVGTYLEHGLTDMEIHTLLGIPTQFIAGIRDKSIGAKVTKGMDYPIVAMQEDYTDRINELCTELLENVDDELPREEIVKFVADTVGVSGHTVRNILATRPDFLSRKVQ